MENEKQARLRATLRGYVSCLVAYSGGVDSTLLAVLAHQELGDASLAVLADSPSLPGREREEALELARQFGFAVRRVATSEFEREAYRQNAPDRCYHCKATLFETMAQLARETGIGTLVYGENLTDRGDHRPGSRAAEDFHVRAPLREACWTKDEIRAWSRQLGLPTAEKPEMACLSSRIPHGQVVTPGKLRSVEQAEADLRAMGFHQVRVRCLEMKEGLQASIEVDRERVGEIASEGQIQELERRWRPLGFRRVTVRPEGYRRGGADLSATPFTSQPGPVTG